MKRLIVNPISLFQIEVARRLWRLQHKSGIGAVAQLTLAPKGRTENLDADTNIHYQPISHQSRQIHDQHMQLQVYKRLANMEGRNRRLLQFVENIFFQIRKDPIDKF